MTEYLTATSFDVEDEDTAAFFDELPLWSAPFGQFLLEHVPLQTGMRVLDIGAGTGFLALELVARCGSECHAVTVDPWPAAAARLRKKVEFLGLTNIEVLSEDAATVSLPDASVDLVVSNLGINNFDDPIAVLRNAYRIASPGAVIALATNVVGHMREFYLQFQKALEANCPEYDRKALDRHIQHRMTPELVASLVATAGFEVRETKRATFDMRFADGSAMLRHRLIRLGFLGSWMALVPKDQCEAVFADLEERLNNVAARNGALALTIPMAYIEGVKPG